MDHDQSTDRLPEIIEYLKMNPMQTAEYNGQHLHIHLPGPPPPAPPPRPTVAEQVIPWLYVALMACIIGTICAFILAVVMVALLIGLIGVALAAVAISFAIKSARESQINMDLANRAGPARRTR